MTGNCTDSKYKFTFGLWTVVIRPRPFGGPVRERFHRRRLRICWESRAYGINFHDNDLIPIDATPAQAAQIKKISSER